MQNENILEEMMSILNKLHVYVPCNERTTTDEVTQKEVRTDLLHKLLFGGDQLTRKRAQAAKDASQNHITPAGRLEGFIPIFEDWHAKKIFLEVCYLSLFSFIFVSPISADGLVMAI